MTDWTLLAIQSAGVLVLTFLFCRNSYRRGHAEGYRSGYAVGKMDGKFSVPSGAVASGSKAC